MELYKKFDVINVLAKLIPILNMYKSLSPALIIVYPFDKASILNPSITAAASSPTNNVYVTVLASVIYIVYVSSEKDGDGTSPRTTICIFPDPKPLFPP